MPPTIGVVKLPRRVCVPMPHRSKPTYPVLPLTMSWYLVFPKSGTRKANPAMPRFTKLIVNASRWSYHELPAWTVEPGVNCMAPPVKLAVPASIAQISLMLSWKLSASQPILTVWSPWSTAASWNTLAPHPRVEPRVHDGSTNSGYDAWASISEFNVTFRMPFENAIEVIGSCHICGSAEESHAWNPLAIQIVVPPESFRVTVPFAMPTVKPVVESGTEIRGLWGAMGILTVSLIVSSRNSYVAPDIFACWKVRLSRFAEKLVDVSVKRYGQSRFERFNPLTGLHRPSYRWNVGSWCNSTVPSGFAMRSQHGRSRPSRIE